MDNKRSYNRRHFIKNSAGAIGTAALISSGLALHACKNREKTPPGYINFLNKAVDGRGLTAGIVGCGNRGTGAALDFINAGNDLKITHLADVFEDKVFECRDRLYKETGEKITDLACFSGFDAYKDIMSSNVDVVILATPPYFRPAHFRAAIESRKHVYMEKPAAVDPVGCRSIIATSRMAERAGLSVVTGTIKRHQPDYMETYKRIYNGAVGRITGGNCYYNQGSLWHRKRREEWCDMEYMLKDWVNWSWLSGDHIVEQHIHNLDVVSWFTGDLPVSALGFGSRQRRKTGDQYDNFSIDFKYKNNMHIHSMCRQIDGCSNKNEELLRGTEGTTNCVNEIRDRDNNVVWRFNYPNNNSLKISPFRQTHIDFVTAIRTNNPINEAENMANSNLTAIMGRVSAYTGQEITREEMLASELKLGPDKIKFGKVNINKNIAIPGV
ncbi:Gfo/Idh/MocA family oxidoreductase [Marinilabiliaceae bacterium ANBcel2]|nr:Gfo/Idh/MocA family oxidoreductase [Marinilabiliaceae bacterium ANBcel2]